MHSSILYTHWLINQFYPTWEVWQHPSYQGTSSGVQGLWAATWRIHFYEVRFPSWTSFQFIGFQFSSWEHVLFLARHTPWESLQYLHWLAHMRPDSRYSLDTGSINFCRLIWFSLPANFSLAVSGWRFPLEPSRTLGKRPAIEAPTKASKCRSCLSVSRSLFIPK